jgi:hypothetical protein
MKSPPRITRGGLVEPLARSGYDQRQEVPMDEVTATNARWRGELLCDLSRAELLRCFGFE